MTSRLGPGFMLDYPPPSSKCLGPAHSQKSFRVSEIADESTKADKRFWMPIDRQAVERVLADFVFDLQPSLEEGLHKPLITLLHNFAEAVGSLVAVDTHKKAIFLASPASPPSTRRCPTAPCFFPQEELQLYGFERAQATGHELRASPAGP